MLDAALLQIAQVGFLEPDDERFRSTLATIRADLEVLRAPAVQVPQ